MAKDDGSLNINRAICNAAGDAERVEMSAPADSSRMMQAIFLKDHVKVGASRRNQNIESTTHFA